MTSKLTERSNRFELVLNVDFLGLGIICNMGGFWTPRRCRLENSMFKSKANIAISRRSGRIVIVKLTRYAVKAGFVHKLRCDT